MGETDSPQISVTLNMEDGTPLDETAKMSDDVIDRILSIDGVDAVGAMTSSGMSLMGMGGSGSTDSVTMYIILKDDRSMTSNEIALKSKKRQKIWSAKLWSAVPLWTCPPWAAVEFQRW